MYQFMYYILSLSSIFSLFRVIIFRFDNIALSLADTICGTARLRLN